MRRRTVAIAAAVALAIVGAGVIGLWVGAVNVSGAIRPLVVRQLEALIGREVAIAGDFDVAPSLAPTLVAHDVTVANAPWGSAPHMLTVERLEVELQLVPLLRDRQVVIDRLRLSGASVLVERGPDGRLNWQPPEGRGGDAPEKPPAAPVVAEVNASNAAVTWHDIDSGQRESARIDALRWTTAANGTLAVTLRGAWREQDVAASGTIGSFQTLIAGEPWPVDLDGHVGGTAIHATGTTGLGTATAIEARAQGERLAELGDLLDVAMPRLGPYALTARLAGPELGRLAAPRVELRLGEPAWGVLDAQGAIGSFADGAPLDLDAKASGQSLQALGERLGVTLPALGAYTATGRIAGPIRAPSLADASGTAGLSNGVTLRVDGARIGNLAALTDLVVPFAAETASLAAAGQTFDASLPALGPARLKGVLARADGTYAIRDLVASAGTERTQIVAEGRIADPFGGPNAALAVRADGSTLAALGAALGVDLAAATPYRIAGRVSGQPQDFRIDGLSASALNSAVTGELRVERGGGIPTLRGALAASRLDLGAIAAAAPAGGGDGTLPLDALRAAAAHLDLRVEQMIVGDVTMGPATGVVALADGRLALRGLDLRALGGRVTGDAALAAPPPGQQAASLDMRLDAGRLDLGALLQAVGTAPAAALPIDAAVAVRSAGATTEAMLAGLQGEASVTANDGRLYETQLNRLVQDVDPLKFLIPFWGQRSEVVHVNCLVGQMRIDAGVAATDIFLDTRRMTLVGEGVVNLREGRLDLVLNPVPKSQALSAAGVPVEISGPLAAPAVRPRTGEAAGRLFGGLIGGLLVPLNQLVRVFGPRARDACAAILDGESASGAAQ